MVLTQKLEKRRENEVMEDFLKVGNVVETIGGARGFILPNKVIYKYGWDNLEEIKDSIRAIYESPVTDTSSWNFSCDNTSGLKLVWERKQLPKITQQEKYILSCVHPDYKYIARDGEDNEIYVYDLEPIRTESWEYYRSDGEVGDISIFNHLFKEITFENSPILISDLLND